jgi:hypothetical protein
MARPKKNIVSLVPIAIIGGLIAAGGIAYGVSRAKNKLPAKQPSRGDTKNLYFVVDDDSAVPVIVGMAKGESWVLVLPDAGHEVALRTWLTDVAKENPQIHFALFSFRMVKPGKLSPGSWGGAEGMVDKQSIAVIEFQGEEWREAIGSVLDTVAAATNLGVSSSSVLQAVGIV